MNELKWTRLFGLVGVMAIGCTDDTTGDDEVGESTETATDSTGDGDSSESNSDTTSADTTTDDTATATTDATDTTDTATDTTSGDACQNGELDQDETDVDCGGQTCGPCADGQMCLAPTDCTSTNCVDGVCAPLGCQVDDDCNGLDGACSDGTCDLQTNECVSTPINEGVDCDSGDLCMIGGVCTAGACAAQPVDCTGLDDACNVGACNPMDGSCVAEPANEGLDCGGLCAPGALCSAGACMGGAPVDCTALDDECNLGTCDPMDGSCVVAPANEGMACNDGEACTLTDVCTAGTCTDPDNPDGYLFAETFANNDAMWTLGTNWSIGPAVAGCGDPALDHTPTDDNGIAGVVRGGCAPTTVNVNFFCLTSPAIDTSALPTVFVNYWRDLWSDYTPYMKNKIEVWNGAAWVIIYETFGAPEVNDAAWGNFSYDVTAHKNAAMQVRWCYNVGQAGAFQRGQWNVDDVTIGQVSCTATP